MKTYFAQVALINKERDEQGRGTERMMTIEYLAADEYDAVMSAKRFSENRLKNCPEWFTGLNCIKVHSFCPARIPDDGSYMPPACGPFFEWKCNYPGTYYQWAQKLNTAGVER